ncbi:MAG: hypothetical protein ACKKL5_01515 [Candidatus Komeilibacteria bacterium]
MHAKLINVGWLIILLSTLLPVVETLVALSYRAGSFWTIYMFVAMMYGFLAVGSEVFYIKYLVKTTFWQKKVHDVLARWLRVANGDMSHKAYVRLDYLLLMATTASFIFGKFGVAAYVNSREQLPWGWLWLSLGWCLRATFEYWLISGFLIWLPMQ